MVSTNFLLKLKDITEIPLKELTEIIPSNIDSTKETAILLRTTDLKLAKNKKSALFKIIQEITDPLFKPVEMKEVSLKTLKPKERISTKFIYLGKGLYKEKYVFVNSKKEFFLTGFIPNSEPLLIENEYFLEGQVMVSRTDNCYYKIDSTVLLEKKDTDLSYRYKFRDDKTLYFTNSKEELFAVKVFYNLEDLLFLLVENNSYFLATEIWKTFNTLLEIIPANSEITGNEKNPELILKDNLELILKGNKEKSLEETLYWLEDEKANVYFISIKTTRDYESFDENQAYLELETMKKGENRTFENVIIKEISSGKYSLIFINKSKIA